MPDEATPGQERLTDALDFGAAALVHAQIALHESVLKQDPSLPAIPGYVLVHRLGGGGAGTVYLAVREGSDRPLALKLHNHKLGESPEVERLWRELNVLEQLRLPAVPRLIDHGVHDWRLYLVTELVDGLPLVTYCERHGLDRKARVRLLARTADAVQDLHEQGVIHRDLKPSNVLVVNRPAPDRDGSPVERGHGRPMLIDLGVAMLLADDVEQSLTLGGSTVGSPAFMAPEQARGERNAISTRSDVYALGATACLLLTGQTPHDMGGSLQEAIRRVAFDEPRPPGDLDPTLPGPLAAVLAKAVRRDPAQRYDSPAALAADLRRWLRREPVEAGGLSGAQVVGRFVARHPIATAGLLCVVVAVLTTLMTLAALRLLNEAPR
jgi:serine/threonine protein kinase